LPETSLEEGSMMTRGFCRARAWLSTWLSIAAAALALAACTNTSFDQLAPAVGSAGGRAAGCGRQYRLGQIRVALILPLSAQGNAGIAATSMKNAAEMALNEFKDPNINCW